MILDADRRAKARQQAQVRTRNRWEKAPLSYAQEQADNDWHWQQKLNQERHEDEVIQGNRDAAQERFRRRLDDMELSSHHGYDESPDYYDLDEDEHDNIQKRYPDLYRDLKPIQDTADRMNSNQHSAVDELVKLGLEGAYLEYLGGYDHGQPGHWEPVVTYLDEYRIRGYAQQNKTILRGIRDTAEYRMVVEDAVNAYTDGRFNPDFLQIALRNFILAVIHETVHD